MALSADTNLKYEIGTVTTVPVKASAQIYLGAAVGFTSGYARGLVAGDDFAGFALENKLGTTDGAVNCAVSPSGQVQLSISSIAVTDIGKPVYASADGTFTLTQSTNSKIGTVSRWVSSGVAIVRYEAQGAGADLSGITVLTDSSGGTANNTIEACAEPVTLTDSTGQSGTHDDTLAATTVPTITATNPTAPTAYSAVVNMTDPVTKAEGEAVSAALATLRGEVATYETAISALVVDVTAITALQTVQCQNASDTAQKIIEIVTVLAAIQNNIADLAAKQNEVINALK